MIICKGRYYLIIYKIWPSKSGRTLGNNRRRFVGGGTAGIIEKRMRDSIGPAGLIHNCCSIIKIPVRENTTSRQQNSFHYAIISHSLLSSSRQDTYYVFDKMVALKT